MRRGLVVLGIAMAGLVLPTGAQAATSHYVLKHPKREHCRAHYVRRVEHIRVHGHRIAQTYCLRVVEPVHVLPPPAAPILAPPPATPSVPTPTPAPTTTPTFTFATTLALGGLGTGEPRYNPVSVSVDQQGAGPGQGVVGVPVTVTLIDYTTGVVLGSFVEASHGESCDIVNELQGNNWVLRGEAVLNPACPLGTIVSTANDPIDIGASFAGGSGYAASSSEWTFLV